MMSITIRGAELTRDTELIGSMTPYVLVRNAMGQELLRTHAGSGKHPVFNETLTVPYGTQVLEFIVLDKEGGLIKKDDDVVGGGMWNCAEAQARGVGQPFQTFVPITYKQKPAGKVLVEVLSSGGMMGGGMMGPGMVTSGYGGTVQPAMVASIGGGAPGYVANLTTTTTQYTPISGYGGAMPVNSIVRPAMMTSGLPPMSAMPPMPPRPVSNIGAIAAGTVGVPTGPPASFGFSSINGRVTPMGAGTIVNTSPMMGVPTGGTIVNSPAFGGVAPMGTVTTSTFTQSAIPTTFVSGMNSGIAPPMVPAVAPVSVVSSALRRSFAGNTLPLNIIDSGPIDTPTMMSNIKNPVNVSGFGQVDTQMSGIIHPPSPTIIPSPTEIVAPPFNSAIISNNSGIVPLPTMSSDFMPASGYNTQTVTVTESVQPYGMGIGGIAGGINSGIANVGAGIATAGSALAATVTDVTNVALNSVGLGSGINQSVPVPAPPSGVMESLSAAMGPGGDFVSAKLHEMGGVRLQKVIHYPSYNLFSLLDEHSPYAQCRVMPHRLRNY